MWREASCSLHAPCMAAFHSNKASFPKGTPLKFVYLFSFDLQNEAKKFFLNLYFHSQKQAVISKQ